MKEGMGGWIEYANRTREDPPRTLLVKALSFVSERTNALDLGSGALNDSAYLLEENFQHVTAVDKIPAAPERAKSFPAERFSYIIEPMEQFHFPANTYDLVNAQYSLPFVSREEFDRIFGEIINSLKEGGVFTGQLFGERDSWNAEGTKETFHSEADARKLFEKLTLIEFTKIERGGVTVSGENKQWHVFDIIAQK